jgi:hypothetical protein
VTFFWGGWEASFAFSIEGAMTRERREGL